MSDSFPRKYYEALMIDVFDRGATIYWKGAPEPFYSPIGEDTPIVVRLDLGEFENEGTAEYERTLVGNVMQVVVAERGVWPVTIEVHTYDSEKRGTDVLMRARLALRWPRNIAAIQAMELSTVHLGNVVNAPVQENGTTTLRATLAITHGQCLRSVALDDGYLFDKFEGFAATVTGGEPDPLTFTVPGNA